MTSAPTAAPARVVAACAPALTARIVRRVPLCYEGGADPALDRPAHVRAGSGLGRVGDQLVVVQDDANFLALIAPESGLARPVPLPAGADGRRQFDDGRGNKRLKMDLEACFVAPGEEGEPLFVALGSGSTDRRERAVVAAALDTPHAARVVVRDARALYAALRGAPGFAPGEMNVEGACYVNGRVRLFGRGNGAAREGYPSLNATCDLEWPALRAYLADPEHAPPPAPTNVVQYRLGEIDGLTLGFTDAAVVGAGAGARVIFSAAAEDSPDATRDGRVSGSVIGVIDARGHASWAPVLDTDGRPFAGKLEGILAAPGDAGRLHGVIDQDAPDVPSELCEVALGGGWWETH